MRFYKSLGTSCEIKIGIKKIFRTNSKDILKLFLIYGNFLNDFWQI
jgi:hypothetical protein